MKMTRLAHLKIGFLNTLFYVLFAVIIGMLGYLAQKHQYTADWTFGNRNTLTESSQALLKQLDTPLEFIAYIPDDPYLKGNLEKHIRKYQAFKADTNIEFVNPELAPERAQQDGIEFQGQVVVKLGDKQETVQSIDESTVANVLQRLSRGEDRLVTFIEGHEERNPLGSESSGMSTLTQLLQRKGFRVQPHNLIRTQNIPQNSAFIVIASPQKAYLPGEVDLIRKYLENGGSMLWLHEPGDLKGLSSLEQDLGLVIHEGTIVDANEELHSVLGIQHPAVIPVIDYNHSGITKNLKVQTLFPFATVIERDENTNSDWHYEDFLMTLPTSWLETDAIEGNVAYEEDTGDKPGPLSIGMTLERQHRTEENGETTQQRVVVIGDSDFMLNAFIGQGGNKDLSLAIFDWMAMDDKLISIKAVSAPDTRLELSDKTLYSLAIFFLAVLPLSLIILGVVIWMRRRKR